MIIDEIIKGRLIEARKDMGISQKEVERQSGINAVKLAKIELGKQRADVATIYELSKLYEVSINWIFGTGKKNE